MGGGTRFGDHSHTGNLLCVINMVMCLVIAEWRGSKAILLNVNQSYSRLLCCVLFSVRVTNLALCLSSTPQLTPLIRPAPSMFTKPPTMLMEIM